MSEEPTISQEEALQRLSFLTAGYMPQAQWTVGGAFRFDRSLQVLGNFLATQLGVRQFTNVAGAPPCKWTLDYFAQRRPIALDAYCNALETYAKMGIGVILVFDNPYIADADIEDSYGLMLVQELYNRDRLRRNAVCVANDKLAAVIRNAFPHVPVHCHYNRLVAEITRRTPALYNKLAEQYTRVCLHAADAAKPSFTNVLEQKEKFDIVVNDPALRTSAVRRDMLKLLADMRRDTFDTSLMARRATLIDRDGEQKVANALHPKASCNLTRNETRALYEAGYRSFVIQSQQFRNEMTLLWDILHCMQDDDPELFNKTALVASSAMAEFGKPSTAMPSGLRQFSFSNYE